MKEKHKWLSSVVCQPIRGTEVIFARCALGVGRNNYNIFFCVSTKKEFLVSLSDISVQHAWTEMIYRNIYFCDEYFEFLECFFSEFERKKL